MKDGVFVRLYKLPTTIRGFSRKNEDMTYTIVLNSRLNSEMQKKCFKHEMKHIDNGDFDRSDDVDAVEVEAHKT